MARESAVFGIFQDRQSVERAVDQLRMEGFRSADISVLFPQNEGTKEFAHDYRYFPDPDLLPIVIDEDWIEEIKTSLPELPDTRKARFMSQYGLPTYDAELLASRKDVADYFDAALKVHSNAKAIGNWVMGDLFRALKDRKLDEQLYINNWPVSPGNLAALVRLIDQGVISGKMAKSLFEEMLASGRLS